MDDQQNKNPKAIQLWDFLCTGKGGNYGHLPIVTVLMKVHPPIVT
jgi:hypothetical protein